MVPVRIVTAARHHHCRGSAYWRLRCGLNGVGPVYPLRMPFDWRAVPLPATIADLPRDPRGFPIPVVTPRGSGEPAFGGISSPRLIVCGGNDLCGVCGAPLGDEVWVVSDGEDVSEEAMAAALAKGVPVRNMAPQAEAPLHFECGLYAAAVCPFLAHPTARRTEDSVVDARGSLRPERLQLRKIEGFELVESADFGFGFLHGRVLEYIVVEAGTQAAERLASFLADDPPSRGRAPRAWSSGEDGVVREAQRVIRRRFPHLASQLVTPIVPPAARNVVRRAKRRAQGAARKASRKR